MTEYQGQTNNYTLNDSANRGNRDLYRDENSEKYKRGYKLYNFRQDIKQP